MSAASHRPSPLQSLMAFRRLMKIHFDGRCPQSKFPGFSSGLTLSCFLCLASLRTCFFPSGDCECRLSIFLFVYIPVVVVDAASVVSRENQEGDCASHVLDLFIERASLEWDDTGSLQRFGVKVVFDWCSIGVCVCVCVRVCLVVCFCVFICV